MGNAPEDPNREELRGELSKARSKLMLRCAVYGYLVSESIVRFSDRVPTAGQSLTSTGRVLIELNPAYFLSRKPEERGSLLIHEQLHGVYWHIPRIGNRNLRLWNLACDVVVNSNPEIRKYPWDATMITADNIDLEHEINRTQLSQLYDRGNCLAEEVYALLKKEEEHLCKSHGPGGDQDLSRFDDLSRQLRDENDEPVSPGAIEAAKGNLSRLVQAANGHFPGKLPGNLGEILEQLRPAEVAWTNQIRAWTSRALGIGYSRSFKRPPRIDHEQFVQPGWAATEGKEIAILVDSSGSVPTADIERFFGEIEALERHGRLHYVIFDAAATEPKLYTPGEWRRISLTRGGTDVRTAFAKLRKCPPLDGAVVFTDGWTPYPATAPPFPTLWVMSDREKRAPFGAHVYLKKGEHD